MQTKPIERYFFFILLILTIILTFYIFKPFWIILVLGASLAIALYPVYEWLKRRKLPGWLSSFLTVFISMILICVPLFGVGILVFNQSQNLYQLVTSGGNTGPFMDSITTAINNILPTGINFDLNQKAAEFVSFLTANIANIFSTTLSTIFSFVLLLIAVFYFLKDGENMKNSLMKLSPLSHDYDQKIVNRLSQTINGVFRGSILTTIIQGVALGIGLSIFNVPNPALWAVVGAIASFVPIVGTALVTVPAVFFLFITGHLIGSIGLAIWAIIAVGLIDNFISPLIYSSKIKIPSFIILFAVLGGLAVLGPVGILIGPLTVSLLYTLISIYKNEFKQDTTI